MVTIIRFDIGDENRRAINRQVGRHGLATRKEIEAYIRMVVRATFESISLDQDDDVPSSK